MHPDARRELILAAALRVYARRGLGDTRHSDVAKEAALAVSTTFHYFPTKPALLTAVLNEVARFLLKDVVASHAHGKDTAPVAIERERDVALQRRHRVLAAVHQHARGCR